MQLQRIILKCKDCGDKFEHHTRMPKYKKIRSLCERCHYKAKAKAVKRWKAKKK